MQWVRGQRGYRVRGHWYCVYQFGPLLTVGPASRCCNKLAPQMGVDKQSRHTKIEREIEVKRERRIEWELYARACAVN